MKKATISIIISTIWISISEFIRNSFLVHGYWISHYQKLNMEFPEKPLNGAVWGIWALCFSIAIYIISRKFSLIQTSFISWLMGFVLMWLVIGNLAVLPINTLFLAIPLSFLETFIATYIIKKFG